MEVVMAEVPTVVSIRLLVRLSPINIANDCFIGSEGIKTWPHQAKANAKAKLFFDVCALFFSSLPIVLWSFSPSRSLSLGVNRPLSCF